MDIQVLQFDERVGLGTFAPWLVGKGYQVKHWRTDLKQFPPAEKLSPIILLGGYMGVNDRASLTYLQSAAEWLAVEVGRGRPILAICLGAQLLAHALGAEVHSQCRQEKGVREISLSPAGAVDPLFTGLPNPFVGFEWHNDSFELPKGSVLLAETEVCSAQAFRFNNAWGVQFHPEVDEPIVAEWCQRTGAGKEPVELFIQHRNSYFAHSKRLLENFLEVGLKIFADA